jgi:hypothetical protein
MGLRWGIVRIFILTLRVEFSVEGYKERPNKKQIKRRKQLDTTFAYNPSCLGGRDWEDDGSRPDWAKA